MIKLYSFYSVGGYKDMYMGLLNAESSSAYYLPLLSIMRKRGLAEEASKIAELDKLDKIHIITKSETFDFPYECKSLFSHGGYTIMYRTLNDNSVCLAIRNLSSSMKDEEGRSTPFTLLFVANSLTDIRILDNVATYCMYHSNEINDLLSPTILYDAVVNGLRADLSKIYNWIISCQDSEQFIHVPGVVDYVMLSTLSSLPIVLKEHNIDDKIINAVVLQNGHICKGKLVLDKNEDENFKLNVNTTQEDDSKNPLDKINYNSQIQVEDSKNQTSQTKIDIPHDGLKEENHTNNHLADKEIISKELDSNSNHHEKTVKPADIVESSSTFEINDESKNSIAKLDMQSESTRQHEVLNDVDKKNTILPIENEPNVHSLSIEDESPTELYNEVANESNDSIPSYFPLVKSKKNKTEYVKILNFKIPVDRLPLLLIACLFVGFLIGLLF